MAEKVGKYKFNIGFALGVILFCWVTVKGSLQIEDGPLISIYGYPFYWHWWDVSAFKVRVINPVTLLANSILYVGISGIAGGFAPLGGKSVWLMLVLRAAAIIGAVISMMHLASFFYEAGVTFAWSLPVGKIFDETWYIGRSYPF